jgi:hypothetical protein
VTLVCPLSSDALLLESVLLESVLLESVLFESVLLALLLVVLVDVVPLVVADVERADCVAAWAARPKPAVAATAVTPRPAVTTAVRRLPCSRDVMGPPRIGVHRTSPSSLEGGCEREGRWLCLARRDQTILANRATANEQGLRTGFTDARRTVMS